MIQCDPEAQCGRGQGSNVEGRGPMLESRSSVIEGRDSGLWTKESKRPPKSGKGYGVQDRKDRGQQVSCRDHLSG